MQEKETITSNRYGWKSLGTVLTVPLEAGIPHLHRLLVKDSYNIDGILKFNSHTCQQTTKQQNMDIV